MNNFFGMLINFDSLKQYDIMLPKSYWVNIIEYKNM